MICREFGGSKQPLIAVLTDFGTGPDESIYAIKSAAWHVNPNVRIKDICHNVPLGNILIGAWRLRRTVSLPTEKEGTIYVAVVDPGVGTDRKGIIVRTKTGKYLVGPDNGLLSLAAIHEKIETAVKIENPDLTLRHFAESCTFDGKDVFAPVAAHLSLGVPLEEFGSPVDSIKRIYLLERDTGSHREGSIVDIDGFGTLRTTVPNHLPKHLLGRWLHFSLSFNDITLEAAARLVRTFGECKKSGEPALVLSSTGNLDLAVNFGNAADHFGIRPHNIGLDNSLGPTAKIQIEIPPEPDSRVVGGFGGL